MRTKQAASKQDRRNANRFFFANRVDGAVVGQPGRARSAEGVQSEPARAPRAPRSSHSRPDRTSQSEPEAPSASKLSQPGRPGQGSRQPGRPRPLGLSPSRPAPNRASRADHVAQLVAQLTARVRPAERATALLDKPGRAISLLMFRFLEN